jgi:hypothetical protein
MSAKISGAKVDYLPNKDLFTISTSYSPEANEYLKDNGFFYNRDLKKHVCRAGVESVVTIQTITKPVISLAAQAKIGEFQGVIDALSCHRDRTGEGVQVPEINKELFNCQKVTLKFIRANKGKCIVGNEWGSGKTYPALVYAYENNIPTIFMCSPDLVEHFKEEIKRLFFDANRVLMELIKVVSFDSAKYLEEIKDWARGVIIDESHRVSDLQSERFKRAMDICKGKEMVILLTGNTVTSWPVNFYTQLRLLGVDITKEKYLKRFFEMEWENGRPKIGKLKKEVLKNFIASFYIRLTLKDVAPELSGENRFYQIRLSPAEQKIYDDAVKNRGVILSGTKVIEINKTLSMLKVKYLIKYIQEALKNDPNTRLAICSQFKETYEVIHKELPFVGAFPNKTNIVFFDTSTYKEGHDMSDYDKFIMLDVYACKMNNLQIKRRFLRLGNQKTVFCIYMVAGLLDMELIKLPDFENHKEVTGHISNQLDEYITHQNCA